MNIRIVNMKNAIMLEKVSAIILIVAIVFLTACGDRSNNVKDDEQLTQPEYQTQNISQDSAEQDKDAKIIDGYCVVKYPGSNPPYYVSKPNITYRIRGVTYYGDDWGNEANLHKYKTVNCPEGAEYIQQQSFRWDGDWQFGTQKKFGLNADDDKRVVKYNTLHIERYGFDITNADSNNSNPDVKVRKSLSKSQVQCFSMALYEDFYEDRPEITVKVYGIPEKLWNEQLGTDMKFSDNQEKEFFQKCKENDYEICSLLVEQKVEKTGVYYIDYDELGNRGNFVQYIVTVDFSKSCEYTYCIYPGDTYEIKDREKYEAWKKANAGKILSGM